MKKMVQKYNEIKVKSILRKCTWNFLLDNKVPTNIRNNFKKLYSLWRGLQLAYGSPSNPSIQEHIGWWFCVIHLALKPHEPMHGSWHCCAMQARLDGHSWWITHSGRQFGGAPSIPKAQEQTARPSNSWHSEFAPHTPNRHGFTLGEGSAVKEGIGDYYRSIKWNHSIKTHNFFLQSENIYHRKFSHVLVSNVRMDLQLGLLDSYKLDCD